MKEYPLVPLGTLISQAKTVKCGEAEYPVLSMTMHNGLVFQDEKFKKVIASKDRSNYKVVYRNQLVISFPIDEGVLAAQRITDAGIVSPAYGIWDINQEKVLPEFLEYALRCERALNYYKSKLRGSTARRRSLPIPTLLAFTVPLPPLNEQVHILAIMHKLKHVIDKREKEINDLNELVKARFVELFGDPGNYSQLNCKLVKLGECCQINPHKKEEKVDKLLKVSFIPMSAVSENGNVDYSMVKYYYQVKTGFTYFNDNDVLFAKITPCMENGKGAVVNGLYNGIGFGSTEFHVLRPIEGVSNPYWIYTLTTFPAFRKLAAIHMTGSAGQRRTPASFLYNYPVKLPSFTKQNNYERIFLQISKSKIAIDSCIIIIGKVLQSGYHYVWGN